MRDLIGHQDLIILSNKSELARLIMIAVGDIVGTYRLARVLAVAVEEQHLLSAPSPHRHASPGNLKVPACPQCEGQDDETASPPLLPPVPQFPTSEVAPKPPQENDLHDAQANFHQQHLLNAPSPHGHSCPGKLKPPACSQAKEQDDEMSSPPLQQPVLQSPSSETAPEPAQESQLCEAQRLQTEVAQQL